MSKNVDTKIHMIYYLCMAVQAGSHLWCIPRHIEYLFMLFIDMTLEPLMACHGHFLSIFANSNVEHLLSGAKCLLSVSGLGCLMIINEMNLDINSMINMPTNISVNLNLKSRSFYSCPGCLRGGESYEKIGTIQRRLAWPLHKDHMLLHSGHSSDRNIYLCES